MGDFLGWLWYSLRRRWSSNLGNKMDNLCMHRTLSTGKSLWFLLKWKRPYREVSIMWWRRRLQSCRAKWSNFSKRTRDKLSRCCPLYFQLKFILSTLKQLCDIFIKFFLNYCQKRSSSRCRAFFAKLKYNSILSVSGGER